MFSTEDLLALEDVFTIGIGFGIAAAYLLARGLLASPATLARASRPDDDTVARARARVDASFGLAALAAGFALQAVGYALAVGGVGASDRTAARALMALTYAAAAAGAAFALWNGLRDRATRSLLVEVARHDPRTGERRTHPAAERLREFGRALGYPALPDEETPGGASVYVRRVFGVEQVARTENKNPAPAGLS